MFNNKNKLLFNIAIFFIFLKYKFKIFKNLYLMSSQTTPPIDDEIVSLKIQILFILGYFVVALFFGLVTLFFRVCKNSETYLSIGNSFSAGIFLGIGFFHLLPHVINWFLFLGS